MNTLTKISISFTLSDAKKVDITKVADKLGIDLVTRGNYFQSLCPFHDDSTPSFTIYPQTNSFFCFGCKKQGDVVDLVKFKYNLSLTDSIEWLKTNFSNNSHIEVTQVNELPKQVKIVAPKLVLYWHSCLQDDNDKKQWFINRGLTTKTINEQLLGWDGNRYVIPVWEGKPGDSDCLGVRLRKAEGMEGVKYKGLKNHNQPTVYGRYYCKQTALAFAGELDSLLAIQDGFSAFSLVNGMLGFSRFPENWANLWFPNTKNLIVVFDRHEELVASKFAKNWNSQKGNRTAKVFQWGYEKGIKDYSEYRQFHSKEEFLTLIKNQIDITGLDFYNIL